MSDYTESRNEQMIKAIINDTPYSSDYTQGRNEQILQSIIDNTPYTKEPESRMEVLLLELKAKIEGGGGEYQAKSVMPDFSDGDVIITPDPEYSALSSVTVEKDTDLIAANIKKDVDIFGVTGTYEMPADIETDMNAVLNKKMGTSITYAPDTWANTVNLMGKLPEKTATGTIASFDDGADDVPVAEGVFNIVATQAGTGDPSPSNVRPISGFTECNIVKAGKNLLNTQAYTGLGYNKGIGYEVSFIEDSSATITTNTISYDVPMWGGLAFKTAPLPAGNYKLNIDCSTITDARISVYKIDENNITIAQSNYTSATILTSLVTVNKNEYIAIWIGSATAQTITITKPQIEVGTTATAYEPYTATPYPVDWTTEAGTVYGGTFDSVTGVLTVDIIGVNLGSLNWAKGTYTFYATLSNVLINSSSLQACSCYKIGAYATTGANLENLSVSLQPTGQIFIKDTDKMSGTEDDFKQAVSGQTITYELETPVTYQLTPQQINTLLGSNNIYCDTGDSTITYRADIDLLIGGLTP